MSWIGIAYLTVVGATLAAVVAMDVFEWDGDGVEPLAWPARIAIAFAWPVSLVWFMIDLARGEAGDRD